jgi:hypothetical protein
MIRKLVKEVLDDRFSLKGMVVSPGEADGWVAPKKTSCECGISDELKGHSD